MDIVRLKDFIEREASWCCFVAFGECSPGLHMAVVSFHALPWAKGRLARTWYKRVVSMDRPQWCLATPLACLPLV